MILTIAKPDGKQQIEGFAIQCPCGNSIDHEGFYECNEEGRAAHGQIAVTTARPNTAAQYHAPCFRKNAVAMFASSDVRV